MFREAMTTLALASSVGGRLERRERATPNKPAMNEKRDPPLSLCEVLASPERYTGKTVTVRATYRIAYEVCQ